MRIFNLALIVLWLAESAFGQIPFSNPEAVGMSSDRLARISQLSKEYVDSSRVAGIVTMVARDGQIVYFESFGKRGMDDLGLLKKDDLFRIFSMTKPITAVAMMQLYEQGKFHMKDPVTKYIPELADLKVLNENGVLVPVKNQMTIQQLMTHTAGFSYGFNSNDLVDQQYSEADLWNAKDLNDFAQRISKLPLKYEPGTQWHYSIAVDLQGLIIERLSGQSLKDYFFEHILQPLQMEDTYFEVPEEKRSRFLPNHSFDRTTGKPRIIKEITSAAYSDYFHVSLYSGGGGLVSTAMDYMIFSECMRNGGTLNGKRILSPKTVKFMIKNHLNACLANSEKSGVNNQGDHFGFGLGFALNLDAPSSGVIGSAGEFNWGGAAGTVFWIDPVENISVVSMIKLMGSPWKLREDLKVAVYQSLLESYEH
ncbi:MAG: beta-lactamase family protein [Saprospiraceae bacterium]|nr:beta-lactamase family protein [Saprospiraceae bacterium]